MLQDHGVDAPAPSGPLQQTDEPRFVTDQGRVVELRERFRGNALGFAPQPQDPGARARGRRAGAPSENRAQMEAGELDHDRLSRSARRIRVSVSVLAAFLVLALLTLWVVLRSEGG